MQRLLLVDDDEEEFELFLSAVKEIRKDMEVIHVDGCSDILNILASKNPQILFLDINMPTVDGIDCLKIIRARQEYAKLPVIMYSTSSNQLSIQQCFDHKANLYVVKSYSYQGLLQVLSKVLNINWKTDRPRTLADFVITDQEAEGKN
jgi:CheY-like chemotaxis protein